MDLSVVVPVRDEEENIAPLIEEICSVLENLLEYEIVYVDDGSSDKTWERLVALSEKLSQLKIVRHRKSYGQSVAIHTGVKAAQAPLIATLDGDGQNDPADIPRLLEVFNSPDSPVNLQLVIGHRRKRQDSWVKRSSGRVANRVRGYLLRDRTPDTGCGLKLFFHFSAYLFSITCIAFFPHLFFAMAEPCFQWKSTIDLESTGRVIMVFGIVSGWAWWTY